MSALHLVGTGDGLEIDWSTGMIRDEILWVHVHDDWRLIVVQIPRAIMDEAVVIATEEYIQQTGGVRAWIDDAIRTAFEADRIAHAGPTKQVVSPRDLVLTLTDFDLGAAAEDVRRAVGGVG